MMSDYSICKTPSPQKGSGARVNTTEFDKINNALKRPIISFDIRRRRQDHYRDVNSTPKARGVISLKRRNLIRLFLPQHEESEGCGERVLFVGTECAVQSTFESTVAKTQHRNKQHFAMSIAPPDEHSLTEVTMTTLHDKSNDCSLTKISKQLKSIFQFKEQKEGFGKAGHDATLKDYCRDTSDCLPSEHMDLQVKDPPMPQADETDKKGSPLGHRKKTKKTARSSDAGNAHSDLSFTAMLTCKEKPASHQDYVKSTSIQTRELRSRNKKPLPMDGNKFHEEDSKLLAKSILKEVPSRGKRTIITAIKTESEAESSLNKTFTILENNSKPKATLKQDVINQTELVSHRQLKQQKTTEVGLTKHPEVIGCVSKKKTRVAKTKSHTKWSTEPPKPTITTDLGCVSKQRTCAAKSKSDTKWSAAPPKPIITTDSKGETQKEKPKRGRPRKAVKAHPLEGNTSQLDSLTAASNTDSGIQIVPRQTRHKTRQTAKKSETHLQEGFIKVRKDNLWDAKTGLDIEVTKASGSVTAATLSGTELKSKKVRGKSLVNDAKTLLNPTCELTDQTGMRLRREKQTDEPVSPAKKKKGSRAETKSTQQPVAEKLAEAEQVKKSGRPAKGKRRVLTSSATTGPVTTTPVNDESSKYVGAHCSIAGGVSNAVQEAVSLGARAFGLFVRNGRTWKLDPLKDGEAERFRVACKEHGFASKHILPHGSYLLNCGSSNPDVLRKSRETLVHELKICELLGLTLYNFHPGSACGECSFEQCIQTIADSINIAHSQTSNVKTVIENMSCQGKTIGGKLEELKAIIDKVQNKSRVGVCIDTCHAFAAGFDLSTPEGYEQLMSDFERVVGLQYLSGMHLNDSKGELGCHLDRHENIGKGKIGLSGFRRVMNDPRLADIPMILETPVNDYAAEIHTLYGLEEKTDK